MIFGRRVTREYTGKLQIVIGGLGLPKPVIRSHYGHGFAKQYVPETGCRQPNRRPITYSTTASTKTSRIFPNDESACQRSSTTTTTSSRKIRETVGDRGLRKAGKSGRPSATADCAKQENPGDLRRPRTAQSRKIRETFGDRGLRKLAEPTILPVGKRVSITKRRAAKFRHSPDL